MARFGATVGAQSIERAISPGGSTLPGRREQSPLSHGAGSLLRQGSGPRFRYPLARVAGGGGRVSLEVDERLLRAARPPITPSSCVTEREKGMIRGKVSLRTLRATVPVREAAITRSTAHASIRQSKMSNSDEMHATPLRYTSHSCVKRRCDRPAFSVRK